MSIVKFVSSLGGAIAQVMFQKKSQLLIVRLRRPNPTVYANAEAEALANPEVTLNVPDANGKMVDRVFSIACQKAGEAYTTEHGQRLFRKVDSVALIEAEQLDTDKAVNEKIHALFTA